MLGNVLAVRCLVFGEALFLLVVWLEVLIFVGYFVLALQGTQVCTFTFGFWAGAIVYVGCWVLVCFLVGWCLASFLMVVGGSNIFSLLDEGEALLIVLIIV